MNKLEELPKKYPELFQNHPYNKGEDSTFFHFECGDGWYNILDCLLYNIRHHFGRYREVVGIKEGILAKGNEPLPWIAEYFEKNPEDPLASFSICQVKEKFGGLRFYWDCDAKGRPWDEVSGAVSLAESFSYRTCEVCGNPGEGRHGGWRQTLCDAHHEKSLAARKAKTDETNS